jgi:hypothetical protein
MASLGLAFLAIALWASAPAHPAYAEGGNSPAATRGWSTIMRLTDTNRYVETQGAIIKMKIIGYRMDEDGRVFFELTVRSNVGIKVTMGDNLWRDLTANVQYCDVWVTSGDRFETQEVFRKRLINFTAYTYKLVLDFAQRSYWDARALSPCN